MKACTARNLRLFSWQRLFSNAKPFFMESYDLPLNTIVDLRLTKDPITTSNSLQLFVNGTCFLTKNPNFSVQLDRWPLPTLQDSEKMFQGAISLNVLNTYSQSVFSQGYMNINFEEENILSFINSFVPDNLQYNDTSLAGSCINTSSENLDTSKPLAFEFLATSAPRFGSNHGSVTLFIGYKTLIRYHTSSGPSDVIALDANYTLSGNMLPIENKIGWYMFSVNIDVSHTCFSNNAIQVMKNHSVSMVYMLLSKLGSMDLLGNLNQITVPTVLGYSPNNLEVMIKEGALVYAGDIALASSMLDQ